MIDEFIENANCFTCDRFKPIIDVCKSCKHPFCGLHIDISDNICDGCHDKLDHTFTVSSVEVINGVPISTSKVYKK